NRSGSGWDRCTRGDSSASERGRAIEGQALAGLRMVDFQAGSMQGQARAGFQRGALGIQPVAEQRVADAQHVHPQLVRAAGDRGQFDPAMLGVALEYLPEGLGRLTLLMIDDMPRLVGGIIPQGQIDVSGVRGRLSPAQRNVALAGLAVMKLP